MLLLSLGQTLECSVEVVFDFSIYLRYDIFLFFSDDLNKLKALLALESLLFDDSIHVELCLAPFIFSAPYLTLNTLIVCILLCACEFHLLLLVVQLFLVESKFVFDVLHFF